MVSGQKVLTRDVPWGPIGKRATSNPVKLNDTSESMIFFKPHGKRQRRRDPSRGLVSLECLEGAWASSWNVRGIPGPTLGATSFYSSLTVCHLAWVAVNLGSAYDIPAESTSSQGRGGGLGPQRCGVGSAVPGFCHTRS